MAAPEETVSTMVDKVQMKVAGEETGPPMMAAPEETVQRTASSSSSS
jgi:hypothetical protein